MCQPDTLFLFYRDYFIKGTAKVLQLFVMNNKEKSVVAGLSVLTGSLRTGDEYVFKIKRKGDIILAESASGSASLRKFKDKVKEVRN